MGSKVNNFLATKRGRVVLVGIAVVLIIVAFVLLILGVLQLKSGKCQQSENDRQKLFNHLTKVKDAYYKTFSHSIIYDPDVDLNRVIDNFNLYDPSPAAIKARTDLALRYKKDLQVLDIDLTKLNPREKKSFAQLEHFLESVFGKPYGEHYYAGDWMMGPDYFCWREICDVASEIRAHFNIKLSIQPKSLADVDKIILVVKKVKHVFEIYTANMMYGVKAGMVRAVDDCKSGLNVFKTKHANISNNGPQGALNDSYSFLKEAYFDNIKDDEKNAFQKKYGKSIVEEMSELVVTYIGQPIHKFITFLDSNYSRHCVPSTVASGLANLPLNKIWLDQKATSELTTMTLPTGEKLDGKKSYELILPYFTTSKKYTAQNIFELGEIRKKILYEEAVNVTRKMMPNKTREEAIKDFKHYINLPKHYFNTTVIPDNENGEVGGKRCYDMKSAEKNCPVRYKAMLDWFAYVQSVLAKIDPMTVDMFYMAGEKSTTPNCPLKMVAKFNPSSGSQSYLNAGKSCLRPCYYQLPFFLLRPGPIYGAYSVAGHEGRPGHHTQVQGFDEHFSSSGQKDVIDWLNGLTYYTAFTEGWALYAENPLLSKGTHLYENLPEQEYGMLKWQIWRALRLVIDTGLHYRGMTQQEALDLFEQYAWDTTDKSAKDIVRYMSAPGQATAYMIGQLAIWKMRTKTQTDLAKANLIFDEKEFHYQILSQGSAPLDYLISYMDNFIECKINDKARSDCQEILDPKLSLKTKFEGIGTEEGWNNFYEKMTMEHHD